MCEITLRYLLPKYKFVKIRPDWLYNYKTGCKLELDMYCADLMIAVEYNGRQHNQRINFFHKSELDFIEQVDRDLMKEDLCIHNGIKLIIVPYHIKNNDIAEYLTNEIIAHLPTSVLINAMIDSVS